MFALSFCSQDCIWLSKSKVNQATLAWSSSDFVGCICFFISTVSCSTAFTITELPHSKTNKMTCSPSEEIDQPGHPASLIRVVALRLMKAWVLSYLQYWAHNEDSPSLIWVFAGRTCHFIGFIMMRLSCFDVDIKTFQNWVAGCHWCPQSKAAALLPGCAS